MQLSDREREVLVETLRGQSRAAVGRKLYLSPDTVKNYLHRIYSKAQVGSRQELIELIDRDIRSSQGGKFLKGCRKPPRYTARIEHGREED